MAERCRICLNAHGCMIDMRDESVKDKLEDLIKCTCVEVKYEENLPSVVCHVCLYKLDMWNEFKEQFIQSNKILLEQLEVSDTSDISCGIKDSSIDTNKDEKCVMENVKRKRLNRSEDSISDNDKKKSKADVSSSELTNVNRDSNQVILDTISISDDDEDDVILSKDSRKALDDPDNKDAENNSGEHTESKAALGPMRARLLPARRGRNIERRKASTKRWVERKKALLAATGENVSDTDSIISDDAQLSPVQKARAKNNADKEAERQKRIVKVLKNLEPNLTEKYTVIRDGDTDSDHRTKLSKLHASTPQSNKKNSFLSPTDKTKNPEKNISSLDSSIEQENSPIPPARSNVTMDVSVKKPEPQADDETFAPYTLKSELVIGDVTYAVTSTLILADADDPNNLTKDSNNDESSREKNTDIIDAVQLRRINNPVTTDANDKAANSKSVERCLNIEVEGNELSILKRVQVELADFVQKEMRHRIFGMNDSVAKTLFPEKLDDVSAVSRKKLDEKLKGIIERAIKKNIETSIINNTEDIHGITRVSPDAKVAISLSKYQPKVVIKPLDISKESKLYSINNLHVLKQATSRGSGPGGSIILTSRKRQIVPPRRYKDYNTSALDSESDKSNEMISPKEASKTSTAKTSRNLATKKSPKMSLQTVTPVKRTENKSIVKVMDNGAKWTPFFIKQSSTSQQKADYEDAIRIEGAITENHICGVCALTFSSRKDVEAHVRTHTMMTTANVTHVAISQNESATTKQPPRQNKQKMMRCKRCHEIVEARVVKSHVCKTATETYKCYVCNSMFRTEKLLVRHLESHDQSEFNIVNAIGNKKSGTVEVSQNTQSATPQEEKKIETSTNAQNPLTENGQSDIQSDKITSTGVKLDSAENTGEKSKETYTCFVCDKIFTDEEVLKDHLQKHCDDLSEGEQSNNKEQFQCAICGDTLETDQALEDHVGKHLFDDEDDNPNLISINQDDKSKNETKKDEKKETKESYCCSQCTEKFDSETSLEMHMQEHEEEVAIAEWEKQGMKVINQYQCVLCDELFDAEEDLAEHLDIHNANAHVCQLCDKPFRTLEDLQNHVMTH